jgi:hypothetical protein
MTQDSCPSVGFVCPGLVVGRIPVGAEVHPGFGVVALCRDGVEVANDYTGKRKIDWYTATVRAFAAPHKTTPVWTCPMRMKSCRHGGFVRPSC